jgi:hypothetical protein
MQHSIPKPNHIITTDKQSIYADGLKIGYHFQDGNGYFVNLIGDVCKGFPNKNYALLWIAGFAERHIATVRNYLLSKEPINRDFVHLPSGVRYPVGRN